MKTCSKCKAEKEFSKFSKNRSSRDGFQTWCNKCLWGYRQTVKGKETRQRYCQSEVGKKSKQKSDKRYQQTNAYRESRLRSYYTQCKLHPEKVKAVSIVGHAVRDGKLQRSVFCEECGLPGKTEGHHPDYSKPLEVDWVCQGCHIKRHREIETGVLVY